MIFYLDEALKYDKQKNNQAVLFLAGDNAKRIAIGFSDSESLKINVRHNYEQLDGIMGSIGSQYNTVRKFATKYGTLGSYGLATINSMLGTVTDKLGLGDDDSDLSNIVNGAKSATEWISEKASTLNSYAQRYFQSSVDSADAYMMIFNGTGVSVSLNMYQYLITDSINTDINKELSVIVNDLMGDYSALKNGDQDAFIGYTEPPHHFETKLSAMTPGVEPNGTLTLYINDIRFRGLILEDLELERSKTRVQTNYGERPLWVKLEYTFKNVVKYTKDDVLEWLNLKSA